MGPNAWLIMGAFWLVQAIFQHANQNAGNVVSAPSVSTWAIGIPAIASILWAVFGKKLIAADKSKVMTDLIAALADGKLSVSEVAAILKTAGFDQSMLADLVKALGFDLLGGGKLGDSTDKSAAGLAFLQQRISLVLASSDLAELIAEKGTPREISLKFKDDSVLSDQFSVSISKQVAA